MITALKNKLHGLHSATVMIFAIVFALSLIVFSNQARDGAAEGLLICRDVILVSVFPFSVAASLLIGSGAIVSSGFAGKTVGRLFGVTEHGAGVILLGAVGGFPTGAYAASELYRTGLIGKSEAERLISYSNNPTPAFMINCVGSLLGSSLTGIFCYLCVLAASFIWGVMIRRKAPEASARYKNENKISFSTAVSKSAYSAVVICGFVIMFSAVSNIVTDIIPYKTVAVTVCSVFEITSGLKSICSLGFSSRLTASIVCMLCSFSGLCILAQVKTETENAKLGSGYYVIGKLIQSVISFFLCYTLYPFILS